MQKLRIILKQHTPLIHFQHDQDGATLRATELKPKLDRFIIENYKSEVEDLIRYPPDSKDSRGFFDYKIKIDSEQAEVFYLSIKKDIEKTKKDYGEITVSSYFGNLGVSSDVDAKYAIFTDSDITVEIICLNSKLKEIINKVFPDFLAKTNFGTRQNKGFGSFYIKDKPLLNLKLRYHYFSITSSQGSKVLNDINLFYRCLKSGINQKGSQQSDVYYFKSLMFMYAKSKGFTWDKRILREKFYLNLPKYKEIKNQRIDSDGTLKWQSENKKEYLFRDLLGLSTEQDWKFYTDKIIKKDLKDDGIERFMSPITFKPIKDGKEFIVFIILNEIPEEYRNSTFKVNSRNNNISIDLPIFPHFDLKDFLTFCINLDIEKHFQITNDSRAEHKVEMETIKNIFKDLKSRIK